jgi:predicted nucleic acid-binding protein
VIVYLDASALMKRYVAEAGSDQVAALLAPAEAVGTAIITRAELAAALAKATRVKRLARKEAAAALRAFQAEWDDVVRIQVTEGVVTRAASLAGSTPCGSTTRSTSLPPSSGRTSGARPSRWQPTIASSGPRPGVRDWPPGHTRRDDGPANFATGGAANQ